MSSTMSGSSAFLVDTNVLVYAYDLSDRAKRDKAIRALEYLGSRQIGALSSQVLGEFFVAVTRKIPRPLTVAEAARSATQYVRSWVVYDITKMVVLEAMTGLQHHGMSYWDALIWATAKLNGVPNVLSEDFSDGLLLEGVRFLDPFGKSLDNYLVDL